MTTQSETINLRRYHWYPELPHEPDFFAPLGDMFHHMRPNLAAFKSDGENKRPFITASDIEYKNCIKYLNSKNPKPKIGLSWRSQKMSGARQAYYMDIGMLAPWMQQYPDIQFVNLQYGDCSEDLARLRDISGSDDLLMTMPDLDLFDDIEGTLGLIASLDMVFSVRNAQASFAGALGIPTVAYYESFFQFGRKFTDPVFPNTLTVHPQDGDEFVLEQLDLAIKDFDQAYKKYSSLDEIL